MVAYSEGYSQGGYYLASAADEVYMYPTGGTDAIEAGLVDEIGTLERAKEIAAEMAGLADYNVKNYPKLKDPLEELLKELGVEVRLESIAAELGVDAATIKEINSLIKERNAFSVQARMPYSLKIN